MDAREFRPIAADMQGRWFAFPIPEMAFAQYLTDLHDLDADNVATAVVAIAAEGSDRPPTAGRIRLKVAELQLGAPIWADVKRQLIDRQDRMRTWEPPEWTCPYEECGGSGFAERREAYTYTTVKRENGRIEAERREAERDITCDCRCRPERIASRRMAESLHPLVREFIAEKYVTWDEVETVGKGGATTLEAQMRTKWEAFIHRAAESRVLAAVDAPAGMQRIEAARSEDERRGGPRRLSADGIAGMLERGAA